MKFSLNQKVKIKISQEPAEVKGRAEYSESHTPAYYISYVTPNGTAQKSWWDEDDLEAA